MIGLLLVLVTCWIGGVAGAVDDDKDEIESLGVSEGENLTIPIHIKKSDEDPQVLVTRLKSFSQEPIAQLTCHNGVCEREGWESGVSLIYDGEIVTLNLMNVSYNQTGLYKVLKLSVTPLETQSYNVTVYQAPRSITSPSVMHSKSSTAGITSAALVFIILVLIITGVFYWKRSKETSYKVSQNDDTATSSFVDP